jgi:raffinose/stachyose/melibiose transport system permease protein
MIHKSNIYKSVKIKWFMFVVPSIVIYLVFYVAQISQTIFYSFTDWSGRGFNFVGLKNYINMLSDTKIYQSISNTLMYAFGVTIIQNTFAFSLAYIISFKIFGKKYLRLLFFMPVVFSALVVGYIWGFILEPNVGTLNTMLDALSLDRYMLNWLGDPVYARFMIIVVTVWQFSGYSMVIFIAGLNAIPKEIFEVSDIDGASGFTKLRYITIPLMAPSITINIILSTIGILKIYDSVVALTGGGPGYTTSSIALMIYTLGFGSEGGRWGYGCAMSVVLMIFIMVISLVQSSYLRRREVEI